MRKKRKKIKLYPKIYPKAMSFARREYFVSYELDALAKGYYNGYVDGVKAFLCEANKAASRPTGDYYESLAKEILDEPIIL